MFGEVDSFLRQRGFYLLDLQLSSTIRPSKLGSPGYTKGYLFDANALYVRDVDQFDDLLEQYASHENTVERIRAKLLKAMSICCLYQHMDYAMEILEKYNLQFTEEECKDIIGSIHRSVPFWRRVLRRTKISSTLSKIYRILT